jgi:hypothetical protein
MPVLEACAKGPTGRCRLMDAATTEPDTYQTPETTQKPIERVYEQLNSLGCSSDEISDYIDCCGWKTLDELSIDRLEGLIRDTSRLSDRIRDAAGPVLEAKKAERRKERSDSIVSATKRHRQNQAATKYPIPLYFPSEQGRNDIFYDLPSQQFV